jgi:DNA-binding NarL/FixJ family response regulator
MTRQLKPCGSPAAYRRHIRHGEPACDACLKAHAAAIYDRPKTPKVRNLRPRQATQADAARAALNADQADHINIVDAAAARFYCLTARQVEVLTLIAAGRSNFEIADTLGIAADSVKSHVKRLFTKLQVDDRAATVAVAYDVGILRTRAQRVAIASRSLRRAA